MGGGGGGGGGGGLQQCTATSGNYNDGLMPPYSATTVVAIAWF